MVSQRRKERKGGIYGACKERKEDDFGMVSHRRKERKEGCKVLQKILAYLATLRDL